MELTARADSFDELVGQNPARLDNRVMLTHYSPERLSHRWREANSLNPISPPSPGTSGPRRSPQPLPFYDRH
jgi:hypothetical protein